LSSGDSCRNFGGSGCLVVCKISVAVLMVQ
jgi:hypothetical protein